jgi:hypothetical protein
MANLLLDQANIKNDSEDWVLWKKFIRKLRAGAMPPVQMPRPANDILARIAEYFEE